MSAIADYQIVSKIYESANSLVYRAVLNSSIQSVILKVLKEDYPDSFRTNSIQTRVRNHPLPRNRWSDQSL